MGRDQVQGGLRGGPVVSWRGVYDAFRKSWHAAEPGLPAMERPACRPFLIHYIVAGGRSTDLCSAFVQIKRMIPGGDEEIIELFRLVFSSGTSADNVVLTLSKPIRLGPENLVGVARAQGTCAPSVEAGLNDQAEPLLEQPS